MDWDPLSKLLALLSTALVALGMSWLVTRAERLRTSDAAEARLLRLGRDVQRAAHELTSSPRR